MGKEIERKYLVKKVEWRSHKEHLQSQSPDLGKKYSQGYIPTSNGTTVRLRIIGEKGYITIKSGTIGHTRSEFEYSIPREDAEEMLNTLCLQPLIEKIRYKISAGSLVWEVDEFLGENEGLIIAEVELANENQQVDLPNWIEREVNDKKYFNSYLVEHPYSEWKDKS
ncbi:MAG: CYTH domain-containing protein [Pleurocapsa sp. MO_192.B19]|nr:CYTH domain-containing protein [Pleurocapsa sp. MO_192.B19]